MLFVVKKHKKYTLDGYKNNEPFRPYFTSFIVFTLQQPYTKSHAIMFSIKFVSTCESFRVL